MIKKMPHSVKIKSGIKYSVSIVPRFDDDQVKGSCNPNTREIKISSEQSNTDLVSVLIHELYHSLNFEYVDLCIVERQVEILEKAFIRLAKLNPKLLPFINDVINGKL